MTVTTQQRWGVNWGVLSAKLVTCPLPTSPSHESGLPTENRFTSWTHLWLSLFLSRAAWHAGSQCPARDGTCVLCNGSVTPNHWATRKVPFMTYFKSFPSDCIFQPSIFYFSSLGALEWFFCIFFFGCTRSLLQSLGFLQLWRMGSRAWRLGGCHAQASLAAVLRLSCPAACGILIPWSGIKPTFSALEGGFLTTGPTLKSLLYL